MGDVSSLFGEWILGGNPSAGTTAPSLRIQPDGSIGGSTGVNRFSGRLDLAALAQGRWATTPLATTMMAGSGAAMAQESRFTKALSEATAIELGMGSFTLLRDGVELLRFQRQR